MATTVVYQGWATKQGQKRKSWKRRYFVLFDDGILRYYHDQQQANSSPLRPLGEMILRADSKVLNSDELHDVTWPLELAYSDKCGFAVLSNNRKLLLFCDTSAMTEAWLDHIQTVIQSFGTMQIPSITSTNPPSEDDILEVPSEDDESEHLKVEDMVRAMTVNIMSKTKSDLVSTIKGLITRNAQLNQELSQYKHRCAELEAIIAQKSNHDENSSLNGSIPSVAVDTQHHHQTTDQHEDDMMQHKEIKIQTEDVSAEVEKETEKLQQIQSQFNQLKTKRLSVVRSESVNIKLRSNSGRRSTTRRRLYSMVNQPTLGRKSFIGVAAISQQHVGRRYTMATEPVQLDETTEADHDDNESVSSTLVSGQGEDKDKSSSIQDDGGDVDGSDEDDNGSDEDDNGSDEDDNGIDEDDDDVSILSTPSLSGHPDGNSVETQLQSPSSTNRDSVVAIGIKSIHSVMDYEDDENIARLARVAIYQFNQKPLKGVHTIRKVGIVKPTMADLVRFLIEDPGISRQSFGDLLGSDEEPGPKVLNAVCDQFDFTDTPLDESMRLFLLSFRIPGESQKIERILETFASRYNDCNPDMFKGGEDSVHILAFSIMMLNTDLHSPNNPRRMTLEDFIKNNRGLDAGQDFDRQFLTDVYNRVDAFEFQCAIDKRFKLEELASRIHSKSPVELVTESRQFIADIEARELYRSKQTDQTKKIVRLFLFNDLLIVTSIPKRDGKCQLRKFINLFMIERFNIVALETGIIIELFGPNKATSVQDIPKSKLGDGHDSLIKLNIGEAEWFSQAVDDYIKQCQIIRDENILHRLKQSSDA